MMMMMMTTSVGDAFRASRREKVSFLVDIFY